MYDDSTSVLRENVDSYREQASLKIGNLLRLRDGRWVRLVGVWLTPRGSWLDVRPGGWFRASDLLDEDAG